MEFQYYGAPAATPKEQVYNELVDGLRGSDPCIGSGSQVHLFSLSPSPANHKLKVSVSPADSNRTHQPNQTGIFGFRFCLVRWDFENNSLIGSVFDF